MPRFHKFQYIYINKRTLKKPEKTAFSEAELLDMEDAWMQEQNTQVLGKRGQDKNEDGRDEEDGSCRIGYGACVHLRITDMFRPRDQRFWLTNK